MRPASTLAYAVIVIGIVLSTILVPPAGAVNYAPSLRTGDKAFYSLSGKYAFNTANAQMEVVSVETSKVTARFTDYPSPGFANGGGLMWIDVYTGDTNNITSNLFFALASGLRLKDPIYYNWAVTIQGDQSLNCGGQFRRLVSTQFLRSGQSVSLDWDQASGVLCDYTANDGNGGVLVMTLTNTTLWAPSSPTTTDAFTLGAEISTLVGAPLVVLILFAFARRRRRRR